jgi:hypothetical protein
VKARNFNAIRTALEVEVKFYVHLRNVATGYETALGSMRGWEIGNLRKALGGETSHALRVERRVAYREVEACVECGARARALEWDCDGPYRTVVCWDEQCKRGRNVDNREWVAGRAPIWGPGHPEWDAMEAARMASCAVEPYAFVKLAEFGPDEPQF